MTVKDVDSRWVQRPWLACLLRCAIVGVPVVVGSAVAWLSAPRLTVGPHRWLAIAAVLGLSIASSMVVSRLTNRLLPLAALLKMTMIFPDRAPSRLKVARQTTSVADIKARLASQRMDESEAAATMLALVTALGRHDRHTRGHSERVRLFCDLLARELRLSPEDGGRLRWAALIHDIGKLEVPAAVLNKPGKLNTREWVLIKEHPAAGARLAEHLREWLGPWFSGIAEHHERYDGMGYPCGLKGSDISLAGRAVAVVDAFETMTAARSYKAAVTTIAARIELTRCAGSHFDPVVVRAFLGIALPRLVWSVGPLAFLVNAPYLAWLGEGGRTLGTIVTASTATAANAAGITAVAVAVSAAPTTVPAATNGPSARQSHRYQASHGQRSSHQLEAADPASQDERNPPSISATKRQPASRPVKAPAGKPPPKPPKVAQSPKPPKPPKPPKAAKAAKPAKATVAKTPSSLLGPRAKHKKP